MEGAFFCFGWLASLLCGLELVHHKVSMLLARFLPGAPCLSEAQEARPSSATATAAKAKAGAEGEEAGTAEVEAGAEAGAEEEEEEEEEAGEREGE